MAGFMDENVGVLQGLVELISDVLKNSVKFVREHGNVGAEGFVENLGMVKGCLQIFNECLLPRCRRPVLSLADERFIQGENSSVLLEILDFALRRFREKKDGDERDDLIMCCEMVGRLFFSDGCEKTGPVAIRDRVIPCLKNISEISGDAEIRTLLEGLEMKVGETE
jgi:hypothetical protein